MIPSHILDGLGPEDRVTILARAGSRNGELHFLVHAASDGPNEILTHAARDGSEILATQPNARQPHPYGIARISLPTVCDCRAERIRADTWGV